MRGINGWLLVYLIGSIPVQLFYAAGLSGWFFDYPIGLFVGIFLVLAAPLVLLVFRLRTAPAWNIASLWVGGGMITLRVVYGVLRADEAALTNAAVTAMATIVGFAITWAVIWTNYFRSSDCVARTFE
jgi:hypothetical protein